MLKEFGPTFSRGGDMDMDFLAGSEVKVLKDKGEGGDERLDQRAPPKVTKSAISFSSSTGICSATASRSASSKDSASSSIFSMAAPVKSAASPCPDIYSALSP